MQKESVETDCVYPYMDRLSNMPDSDIRLPRYHKVVDKDKIKEN